MDTGFITFALVKSWLCFLYLLTNLQCSSQNSKIFKVATCRSRHRRLQSFVGTRARLGYAGFDAQLQRILSLHYTLYVYVRACVSMHMLYIWGSGSMPRVFASGPRDMRTRNNPGNARVCPGLQAPMEVGEIFYCTTHGVLVS